MNTASSWATVILAVVALAGLLLTLRVVRAAQDDVQQSRYARIDARAPRVIVRDVAPPALPAALGATVVTPTIMPLTPEMRFDRPGQDDRAIRVTAYAELLNEGAATAFLHLPAGAIVVTGTDARPDDQDPQLMHWAGGQRLRHQLAPGESCWLLLEGRRTVAEWARLYEMYEGEIGPRPDNSGDIAGYRFVVDVEDQFAEGVHDEIAIDVLILPLVSVQGSGSAWQPRGWAWTPFTPAPNRTDVQKTVRHYPKSTRRPSGPLCRFTGRRKAR